MCIGVWPACIFACQIHWNLSYELGSYELPCGFWELNAGPLEESQCIHPQSHLSRFNRILTGHLV